VAPAPHRPSDELLRAERDGNGHDQRVFSGATDLQLHLRALHCTHGRSGEPARGSSPQAFRSRTASSISPLGGARPDRRSTMTVNVPTPLPRGTVYWKYGPTSRSRRELVHPALRPRKRHHDLLHSDGGLGATTSRRTARIVDQGGPGVGSGSPGIPALDTWDARTPRRAPPLLGMRRPAMTTIVLVRKGDSGGDRRGFAHDIRHHAARARVRPQSKKIVAYRDSFIGVAGSAPTSS